MRTIIAGEKWRRAPRASASRAVALCALGLTLSCRASMPVEQALGTVPTIIGCDERPCPDGAQVRVVYLGVSGFLIQYRGASILTGPSFTNPSLDSVTPTRYRFFRGPAPAIAPNTRLIEQVLPRAADSASMILIGHGHYDHLLDVPYIATHRAPDAVIYGGPTVRHMLMGDSALRADPRRIVAMPPDSAGSATHAGEWFYNRDSSFRVMPLVADHAPTVRLWGWGALFARGTIDHDLDRLPRKAEDWKLGEPYSFLIDVLARGDTTPMFRIYYQDAPNTPPLGFPPPLDGRRIDVAILCVATSRNVKPPSPDSLLRVIRPRYVIAAHWESFFRPQTQPVVVNSASDIPAFINSLGASLPSDSRWVMPQPQAVLRFPAGR